MADTLTSAPRDHFITDLDALAPNGHPEWVKSLRTQGRSTFDETPFPHNKMEEWRQTNISSVVNTPFRSLTAKTDHGVDASAVATLFYAPETWTELVFVDGYFDAGLSKTPTLPEGVFAGSLVEVLHEGGCPNVEQHLGKHLQERNAYTALNNAFLQDGAYVYVSKNIALEQPIHLVFLTSKRDADTAAHIRNLIVLEESAEAQVVCTYAAADGTESYLNNVVDEIVLGANAKLDWHKLVLEGETGNHLATTEVHHERDSRLNTFTFSLEGAVTRNQICTKLAGSGAETNLHGLYLNDGDRLIDNALTITHAVPNCNSRIAYKGILDDTSKSVFTGFVHVYQEAQQTDSDQLSQNLLLSDGATIDSKPQLEIYADDVKCTHGATVGAPPEEVIFYFRSRGIDEETARGMLTYAFADEVAGDVAIDAVAQRLDRYVYEKYSPKF